MLHIVSAESMKLRDSRTIHGLGVPSAVLMERAAYECALAVLDHLGGSGCIPPEKSGPDVLILCGSGNNGGDGFACARILSLKNISCEICFAGNPDHMTEETARQYGIVKKLGIPVTAVPDFHSCRVIVDALFGIGISRDITGSYAALIRSVNETGIPVIAVDIPSGIDADTGAVRGCAVKAFKTVTMQYIKPGLLLYPGALHAGEIITADIGVAGIPEEDDPDEKSLFALEPSDLPLVVPERNPAGNKGDFGKVLIAAGSRNMAGAAVLAARAAMRTGAGMVRVLTEECNREILQTAVPEALLSVYTTEEEAVRELEKALDWADAAAAGPGIGRGAAQKAMIERLLACTEKPLLLDADALNIISESLLPELAAHRGPVVITPHIGEMARLSGRGADVLKADPVREASAFADRYGVVCVMKDARTVTAVPGGPVWINRTGNDGMATAGSGDVLTGITAALLGRKCSPAQAGALGAFIHGMAGDLAAASCGRSSMTASDITDALKKLAI